jgi:hypothetical protein
MVHTHDIMIIASLCLWRFLEANVHWTNEHIRPQLNLISPFFKLHVPCNILWLIIQELQRSRSTPHIAGIKSPRPRVLPGVPIMHQVWHEEGERWKSFMCAIFECVINAAEGEWNHCFLEH